MKKFTSFIAMVIVFAMTIGCSATDDAWKDNIGTVNLDLMSVTGNGISIDGNIVKIISGGDFTITGTLADGMIYVNADSKVKLRLSGCSITNSTGPAIYFDDVEEGLVTITENTENFIEDGSTYTDDGANAALFSNDDLEIKGNGTLTVTANYKHGIASDDDLLIENGNIIIKSNEHGIKVNNTLHITGGNITVKTQTGKGMKAEQELVIDNGNIVIDSFDEGIESKGTLVINGGNIDITSAEDGINTGMADTSENQTETDNSQGKEEHMRENMTPPQTPQGDSDSQMQQPQMRGGREGKMPNGEMSDDRIPPSTDYQAGKRPDGNMPKNNNGDGSERQQNMTPPQNSENNQSIERQQRPMAGGMGKIDEETAKAHSITINDGYIYIKADGDGIDSNGNLTINGGTVIIDGPTRNGDGSLDSEGTMSITGGTVLTVSNGGMVQMPANQQGQHILSISLANKQPAGTQIAIKDADGNELIKYTSVKEFGRILFFNEEIKEDSEYTLYINGEENITVTAGANSFGTSGKMQGGRQGGFDVQNQSVQSDAEIKVKVNNKFVSFDTNPILVNDTTLVGFRAILEALGADVDWDEQTQTVTASKGDTKIKLVINSKTAYVNGKENTLNTAPQIIGSSTMVPVRFISEQLNMNVDWDEQNQLVTISA